MPFRLLAITFAILLVTGIARAATDNAYQSLARDIFKELIEIDTTDSVGNVTTAAEAMAKRLRDAGLPAAGRPGAGPERAQGESGRRGCTAPASASRSCCSGTSTWSRRSREDWTARSVQVHREGRLLLRPRHRRRQGAGGHLVANLIRLQARRVPARPRHHRRAHGRRGRRRACQRRRVAAQEPSRSHRGRVRDQRPMAGRCCRRRAKPGAINEVRAPRRSMRRLPARPRPTRWSRLRCRVRTTRSTS